MLRTALCFLAAVTLVSADGAANQFFDGILQSVSQEIRNEGFDTLGVKSFDLKVKSTGILNRDFKASFSQGSLIGLSTGARDGNCSHSDLVSGYSVTCNVVMPHARFSFSAVAKGDDITGRSHFIATTTYLTNVRAEVTIEGRRGFPARFHNLVVTSSGPLKTDISEGKVTLNSARRQNLLSQINEQLSREIQETFVQQYAQMYRIVVPRHRF